MAHPVYGASAAGSVVRGSAALDPHHSVGRVGTGPATDLPAEVGRDAALVVYGATAAGVMAAVAAARRGISTVLLEPGRHIGGMTSGGLGYTDLGERSVIGGLAREFGQAVAEHYGAALWKFAGPEPHVAESILSRWLEQAEVETVFDAALSRAVVTDGVISEIVVGGDRRYRGGVFIDASYEGDLLAAAGVDHLIGREDRTRHGEPLAGRREYAPGMHNFPPWISPFGAGGELLPLIRDAPLAQVGAGDGGVMAYGYRLCLTSTDRRMPFTRRDGYDPAEWELGRRYFDHLARSRRSLRAGQMIGLEPNLPNDKCDGNSLGPFSLNLLDGSSWGYPASDRPGRDRITLRHQHYTLDFLYFLSHDPAVPASIRAEMSRWGWPLDEFLDTAGLPHQLYVREARRMQGEYVLREQDLRDPATHHSDVVAMGSYHIDIREVQRTWTPVYEHPKPIPMLFNEGYLSVPVAPYQIPYRCLLPRVEQCRNLLVPVCLSASHVAFASVRMETQYQMLGAACGVAAALALNLGLEVHRVPISQLQDELLATGQVLSR